MCRMCFICRCHSIGGRGHYCVHMTKDFPVSEIHEMHCATVARQSCTTFASVRTANIRRNRKINLSRKKRREYCVVERSEVSLFQNVRFSK